MQNDEAPEERDEFGWETHQYGFEVCEADGHKTRTVWTTFGVPSYSDPVRYQCCPIFEAPQTRLIYPTANEQTQIDSVDRGSVAERYFTLAIICFGVGIGIGRIAWDEGSTISWSIASIFGLAGMLFGLLSFRTAWA
jgi:hypothetical protein